jgi:hypothetical protein
MNAVPVLLAEEIALIARNQYGSIQEYEAEFSDDFPGYIKFTVQQPRFLELLYDMQRKSIRPYPQVEYDAPEMIQALAAFFKRVIPDFNVFSFSAVPVDETNTLLAVEGSFRLEVRYNPEEQSVELVDNKLQFARRVVHKLYTEKVLDLRRLVELISTFTQGAQPQQYLWYRFLRHMFTQTNTEGNPDLPPEYKQAFTELALEIATEQAKQYAIK